MAFGSVAALLTDLADRLKPSGVVRHQCAPIARGRFRGDGRMMIAHFGIEVFISAYVVKSGEVESDVKRDVGDYHRGARIYASHFRGSER